MWLHSAGFVIGGKIETKKEKVLKSRSLKIVWENKPWGCGAAVGGAAVAIGKIY